MSDCGERGGSGCSAGHRGVWAQRDNGAAAVPGELAKPWCWWEWASGEKGDQSGDLQMCVCTMPEAPAGV